MLYCVCGVVVFALGDGGEKRIELGKNKKDTCLIMWWGEAEICLTSSGDEIGVCLVSSL